MKKVMMKIIGAALITLISIPGMAALYGNSNHPANVMAGVKSIAITIETPTNYDNGELIKYGVTKENLEKLISQRLSDAGIDVIPFSESLEDPAAAVLNLKIRLFRGWGLVYSYGLNLSLNQKAPLLGNNAYHSTETWSDWLTGGTQQSGLPRLNGYIMQLVENFVNSYKAQN